MPASIEASMNEEVKAIITTNGLAWDIMIEKCGTTIDIPLLLIILIYSWWKCEIGKAMAPKMVEKLGTCHYHGVESARQYVPKENKILMCCLHLTINSIDFLYIQCAPYNLNPSCLE